MARILVVDDDPDILEALELALSSGHDVVVARDGQDALERLDAAGDVDLVLLDLMMPRMNGGELVHALRARGVIVPVIIASAAHDVRRQAEELSASDYLAKPYSLKALRQKIAGVLGPSGGSDASGGGSGPDRTVGGDGGSSASFMSLASVPF